MIEVRNLTKRFEKEHVTALDNISCTIESNKIVGFIGPDGAGKTTLLRILAGILTPTSGEVLIDGKPLDLYKKKQKGSITQEELHEMISYMPQKFGLYEDLSIIENLTLYAQLRGIGGEARKKAFEEVLAMTKLENFQQRLAGNLSGGMKQKLGLACALLKKPKILILDEPSVGVDPISRQDLIAMVNSMLDKDTTVLWSTAYLDEAEELDHVILMNEGKVTFEGQPKSAIQKVEGRMFLLKDVHDSKRLVSIELMKHKSVIDSVIVGKDVKFLTDGGNVNDVYDSVKKIFPSLTMPVASKPIFEDACVDILGGLSEKVSPVGQYYAGSNFEGNETVVEAIHLTKKFGEFTAVGDVSFGVKRGKIFGLLGPNGSGKSTTFRMLCGLLIQNKGTAKVMGIDIANMGSDAKMNIGYMAQKFSLYGLLTVRQNLEFSAGAYRLTGKSKKEAVDRMIEIFHLQEVQNINSGVLSLGFKQRLSLACAIMHRPPVLFLDEPTSGVDPITRKEFWMHINAVVTHGVSVVVTTHFMDEAENCDDMVLIYKGKIRAQGTPDDLKSLCKTSEEPTLQDAFIEIVKNVDAIEGRSNKSYK
ncbi:MAG: ABC transporter ATP-binding protein [Alphaproteobacteria bacterium]|nr:ABC transporter ATP-binding protein [Alphaproteobacteria bacterium]